MCYFFVCKKKKNKGIYLPTLSLGNATFIILFNVLCSELVKKKTTVESTVTTLESTKEYIYSTVDALDAVMALLPGLPVFLLL